MNPRYEHIGIDQVISRAKVQLRLQNTSDYDSFLELMIFEAMGSLGVLSMLRKDECPLSITNGTAKLPDNFIKLIAITADINVDPDSNDPITAQLSQCGLMLYADVPFMNSCGCNTDGGFAFNAFNFPYQSYQINNGYVHVNNPHGTIVNAKIAYYGTNTDKDGRAIIFSRYERALFNYACWMYTLANPEGFNQYIIEKYESIWVAQKSMLRAQDVRFKFELEAREIQNILSAMVISKAVNFINS
jgi:hypothetical protein